MTSRREIVQQYVSQGYEGNLQWIAGLIERLIPEDITQQQEEKERMEARFTALETQLKSLTSELEERKKTDKQDMENLRNQLTLQLDLQNKMHTDMAKLQAEVLERVAEVGKLQMQIISLQQELETQKKMQVDIKQLQSDLESIKASQPDIQKLQKQIADQVIKEIKQTESKVPKSNGESSEALRRIQAAEKEVQDLKQEVQRLKNEKMKEKQIYDENMQAEEEKYRQYRDTVLKRLENMEHDAKTLEVHTDRNTKERQDLAGKLDRRTFDNFAVQISEMIKKQTENSGSNDEKWTAILQKNNEEYKKKLDKMAEYIVEMENGWKKTVEKLMKPPPPKVKEVNEAAVTTTMKCLACRRGVDSTTKNSKLSPVASIPSKQTITAGNQARFNETKSTPRAVTNLKKCYGALAKGSTIHPRSKDVLPPRFKF